MAASPRVQGARKRPPAVESASGSIPSTRFPERVASPDLGPGPPARHVAESANARSVLRAQAQLFDATRPGPPPVAASTNRSCTAASENGCGLAGSTFCTRPTSTDSPTNTGCGMKWTSQRHGDGVFPTDTLSCDLTGDCCGQFDEDLCASALLRATTVSSPVGRGEQHVTALGSDESKIVFSTPNSTAEIPLVGQVGYSSRLHREPQCVSTWAPSLSSGTSLISVSDTCPDGMQPAPTKPVLLTCDGLWTRLTEYSARPRRPRRLASLWWACGYGSRWAARRDRVSTISTPWSSASYRRPSCGWWP